ncbi:MAG: hypothetical protein WB239_17895 [Acidimicrobiia bacterium]
MGRGKGHDAERIQARRKLHVGRLAGIPVRVRGRFSIQRGWNRRSEQRLEDLKYAPATAGIFADRDLADMNLGLDTSVWFTRRPVNILNEIFYEERALGYHLGFEELKTDLVFKTHTG